MGALTVSDLSVLAAEPLVRDVLLGQRLGMAQPLNIRKTIDANRAELEGYGSIHAARELITGGKGARREVTEYHLNEPQALLLCMLARMDRAAEVRRELIGVFMAWRRGELAQERPDTTGRRVAAIVSVAAHQPALESLPFARALAHLLPAGRRKAYPRFWSDIEVREFLIRTHRQCEIAVAFATLLGRVGRKRTPSKSAIQRFWAQLDRVRSDKGLH